MQFLISINGLKKALIDIEVFSQDSSQYIAKGNGEDARLGVFTWWEIPEVVGNERAESYEYLPILRWPGRNSSCKLK